MVSNHRIAAPWAVMLLMSAFVISPLAVETAHAAEPKKKEWKQVTKVNADGTPESYGKITDQKVLDKIEEFEDLQMEGTTIDIAAEIQAIYGVSVCPSNR